MKNMLITGGAGFIGSNFVHFAKNRWPHSRLIIIDKLTYAGRYVNLEDVADGNNCVFIEGDICDAKLLGNIFKEEKIDSVVHFAAESHVDRSIAGPDEFIRTNIVGTHEILKAARYAWKDKDPSKYRFHHISTDEVYGSLGFEDCPFTEETAYNPSSPYSASKAASDHLVRAYYRTFNLPVTLSNCSNNYGPYQHPEKLIPVCISRALAGHSIPVYGKGENIRDWLHVSDHCMAIAVILESGKLGETYNIGGNQEVTNIDVVRMICGILDELNPKSAGSYEKQITFVKDRPGHDLRYAINANKIEQRLGFSPKYIFTEGLRNTIKWYLENKDWWIPALPNDIRNSLLG